MRDFVASFNKKILDIGLYLHVWFENAYSCPKIKTNRPSTAASMARDDPPASSTAAAMHGKVGSEFET